MRVTTQMLNKSAREAGLSTNNTSLLNYIKSDNSGNSLASALKKGNKANSAAVKSAYEKLANTSDKLTQSAVNLLKSGDKSEGNKEIYNDVKGLVSNYNETMKLLNNNPSTLNNYYKQMMKAAAQEGGEDLKSIGISVSKDGTMSIDEKVLKAADAASVEKILGSSSFVNKIGFISEKISSNAQATVDSQSSQYSGTGSAYSAYNKSKYNFWG